uniref:Reverse transcriptase Ty1/copia-type domain-containing protein n=1 Tax=Trichogramma kaykai TaxID=54128 RepID=A0ABD2X7J8_9HYME
MNTARCLLADAGVQKRFWPEIVCAATYLKNRTLANTVENKTPYEIFFNKKPNVENLKLYGSKVFVRKPEQRRKSKFEQKSEMGVLVGYSEVGYRVLLNNKVIVSRQVEIVERDIKCIGLNLEENSEEISDSESNEGHREESEDSEYYSNNEEEKNSEGLRRSSRVKKSPMRYPEPDNTSSVSANVCRVDTPRTFEEAIISVDKDEWVKAMDREIEVLKKNKTWKVVEKIEGKKTIDVKWVYTRKTGGKYKARLVVRGFQQKDQIEDVYAPVAKVQTLKTLLAYCCQYELNIQQMDVEAAFLNGKVKTEVYVNQPKGYADGTNKVCKLLKALNGLRESPRAWYECLDEFLVKIGFRSCEMDNCLYIYEGEEKMFILIYVYDLLICSNTINEEKVKRIKNMLSERFKMKDLGNVNEYLSIKIEYDLKNKMLKINQTRYIETLIKNYQLSDSKLYNTPMEINLKLDIMADCKPDLKYRNIIGALLYISSSTRPDVSYSVNYLSRFQNCYNRSHWKYALRVLKYLYKTKNLSLVYKQSDDKDIMDCYVDADWAGDNNDRKSTSGYVIRLFGNPIYWKSRKQKCITKASTYAEYVALSEAVSEIKFVREILTKLNVKLKAPVKIYEDNTGAIDIAKNGNLTKNSKHIEIHYHFVHESVKNQEIEVCKIDTSENVADIFTKALGKEKHIKFRDMLNIS